MNDGRSSDYNQKDDWNTAAHLLILVGFFSSCRNKEVVGRLPPVVYVPGIWDVPATFDRMAEALAKAGWQTHAVSLQPDDGSASLSQLAEELRKSIDDRLGTKRHFDIVAFSMGGLVARYYVQKLGGHSRVIHFVTISTPHHGTKMANLGNRPGFLEMRPGSAFLLELNKDAGRLSRVLFPSIWSHLDLLIQPADSSRLPFGRDVEIPVILHNWMLADARVINAVLDALAERK